MHIFDFRLCEVRNIDFCKKERKKKEKKKISGREGDWGKQDGARVLPVEEYLNRSGLSF